MNIISKIKKLWFKRKYPPKYYQLIVQYKDDNLPEYKDRRKYIVGYINDKLSKPHIYPFLVDINGKIIDLSTYVRITENQLFL